MPKLELYPKYQRAVTGTTTRSSARSGGVSPGIAEGPGIDVVGNRVGLGGDKILLYDAGGDPVAEYTANMSGMAGAISDAADGDVIWLPAYTIGGDHTIPEGVEVTGLGANSILSGTITNEGILNNVNVSGTLTNSATLDWAIDDDGYWQTTRWIGVGISPCVTVHADAANAVMRVSSPDTGNPTFQAYFRDGTDYSGWALLRDGQGGSDDLHLNWDATEDSATRTDISIQDTTGQVVLGGTNAEVPIAVARARLIVLHDGIQVQTTVQNAALTLNAGTGAAAGNQVAFIDLKLNNVLKGNIACSEATSGNPLEINSSTATNVSMVTGGGDLGIGMIAPAARLDVRKDGTSEDILALRSDLGTNDRQMRIISPATDSVSAPFRFETHSSFAFEIDTSEKMRIDDAGRVGIGISSSIGATLHVDQSSNTGAIPVLTLDQADIDQVLVKIIGTAAAASADRTLVAASDYGTPGALVGWFQIEIQDDGDRIADGDYYLGIYAAPT